MTQPLVSRRDPDTPLPVFSAPEAATSYGVNWIALALAFVLAAAVLIVGASFGHAADKPSPVRAGSELDVKLPPEVVALAKKLDGLLSADGLGAISAQVDIAKLAWLDGARTTAAGGFIVGVVVTLFLMGNRKAAA